MASFYDIIGQKQIAEHFQHAIKSGQISHAYILDGEEGTGKRFISLIFATALQCEKGGENPCGECHSCKMALSGNHPDIVMVRHEKPNIISVDEIRTQIVSDVLIKPYSSPHKIYIVPDATMMTQQAQNALLKTLEEPPAYAIIILLTDNKEKLLSTLLSRSLSLSIKPVRNSLIKEYLEKNTSVDKYRLQLAAAFARGSIGRAIKLAEDEEFEELKTTVVSVLERIDDYGMSEIMDALKKAAEFKDKMSDYLDLMLLWYRDVLMCKASSDSDRVIFVGEERAIKRRAEKDSYEKINRVIDQILITKKRLDSNVNLELSMEMLLLTMKGK
ncbi:MAG: DNA polymerase III subunit delta [Lachnospiraceae bacterium]|nr:DNA polymerase III subunit delta [Lachnospiraceae bacterium]